MEALLLTTFLAINVFTVLISLNLRAAAEVVTPLMTISSSIAWFGVVLCAMSMFGLYLPHGINLPRLLGIELVTFAQLVLGSMLLSTVLALALVWQLTRHMGMVLPQADDDWDGD